MRALDILPNLNFIFILSFSQFYGLDSDWVVGWWPHRISDSPRITAINSSHLICYTKITLCYWISSCKISSCYRCSSAKWFYLTFEQKIKPKIFTCCIMTLFCLTLSVLAPDIPDTSDLERIHTGGKSEVYCLESYLYTWNVEKCFWNVMIKNYFTLEHCYIWQSTICSPLTASESGQNSWISQCHQRCQTQVLISAVGLAWCWTCLWQGGGGTWLSLAVLSPWLRIYCQYQSLCSSSWLVLGLLKL